jgi:flagella basal body P-ring formation protein FlgA
MKKLIFFLSLFLAGALGFPGSIPGASPSGIFIHFKTHASVQQDSVYLEDIAEIQGVPRSMEDRISHLTIEKSPLPGKFLILTKEEIALKIKPINLPYPVSNLQIPEQIEVVRTGRLIEREELTRALEDSLQQIIDDRDKTVKVKDLQGGEQVIILPGLLTYEFLLPDQARRGGNLAATVNILVDGREIKKIRVQARVEIYAEVVSARGYLQKKQEITDKDVQKVNKNIALLPPDILTDLEEVIGKRTTLSINNQEILRKNMVEIPPLVKKGDPVALVIENNQFRISTFGEVKEEGRKGDRVKLLNVSSKKEVWGRVLDAHTVQVEY